MHPCVLWLNGALGVGKTAADPELLGSFLADAEESWGRDDQEHPGWPALLAAGVRA